MSDAAAFTATLVNMKIITSRQCVQFMFEEDVSQLPKGLVDEILGGIAALVLAKNKYAIARLNNTKDVGDSAVLQITPGGRESSDWKSTEGAASKPARSRSQEAFLLCNQPRGRVFLEQKRRHAIPANNQINNTDEAKHVLRAWLDVDSLSELDRNPRAADQWERIEADYKTWLTAAIYVEE